MHIPFVSQKSKVSVDGSVLDIPVNKNLSKLGIKSGISVTNQLAENFLKGTKTTFDIIYIDPPYKSGLGIDALKVSLGALEEDGVIVYEEEEPFSGNIEGLTICDRRKYGRVEPQIDPSMYRTLITEVMH